jgi:hypothetical protein
MVDADLLHQVIDVIDKVLDGGAAGGRPLLVDFGQPAVVLGPALRAECLEQCILAAASSAAAPAGTALRRACSRCSAFN